MKITICDDNQQEFLQIRLMDEYLSCGYAGGKIASWCQALKARLPAIKRTPPPQIAAEGAFSSQSISG